MAEQRYERIGSGYARVRVEDPRIAAQIHAALGDACRVVNIGAGAGSYEPAHASVVAIEPSATMVAQRAPDSAPVAMATGEALPRRSDSFDAAMASLTIHHWIDLPAGLAEMRRVAPRQVIFFFEPLEVTGYWLLDYFPEMADAEFERNAPGVAEIGAVLNIVDVRPILVPPDCLDGFVAAYWIRPEAYLEARVQAGMSALAMLDDDVRAAGTERLRADIESGEWERRFGHLRALDAFDGGYRLAVAEN